MAEMKIRDRMTVVGSVYHQPFGEEPSCVESRFSRELETSEQPYKRKCKATEEWKQLGCGWLAGNVGMLVIMNDEGRFPQVVPSDEERKDAASKVLEIAYDVAVGHERRSHHSDQTDPYSSHCWLIPPTESMRACPSDAASLQIRCQSGTAKFTLYLLPK